jgi:hypothetical protein
MSAIKNEILLYSGISLLDDKTEINTTMNTTDKISIEGETFSNLKFKLFFKLFAILLIEFFFIYNILKQKKDKKLIKK